jgi:hypothetical protein
MAYFTFSTTSVSMGFHLLFEGGISPGAFDGFACLGDGGVARGFEQPAGEDGLIGNLPGFLRENDEHGLGDFLSQMRVAHLPQRRRIDEPGPAGHKFRKGGFAVVGRVFAQ